MVALYIKNKWLIIPTYARPKRWDECDNDDDVNDKHPKLMKEIK